MHLGQYLSATCGANWLMFFWSSLNRQSLVFSQNFRYKGDIFNQLDGTSTNSKLHTTKVSETIECFYHIPYRSEKRRLIITKRTIFLLFLLFQCECVLIVTGKYSSYQISLQEQLYVDWMFKKFKMMPLAKKTLNVC